MKLAYSVLFHNPRFIVSHTEHTYNVSYTHVVGPLVVVLVSTAVCLPLLNNFFKPFSLAVCAVGYKYF